MDSEDDTNSIRNEAHNQNRQETLLFFEEQPNVFKETLEQALVRHPDTRYAENQRRTEGDGRRERQRQNLPLFPDAESRHPSAHQHRRRMMPPELLPESDSESSYPLQKTKKDKKKKAKLCKTCYPMSEYEGFDAVQAHPETIKALEVQALEAVVRANRSKWPWSTETKIQMIPRSIMIL